MRRMVNGICRLILRRLRCEKERVKALAETNSILSAYIAFLIESKGTVRVPRRVIRDYIGNYSALIDASGEDYVIEVVRKGVDEDCGKRSHDGGEGNGESLERRLSR